MPAGIVKWFNNAKGYGFIRPEQGGEDIFAHFSAIDMEGFRTLRRGQPVAFELHESPKGLQARRIQPLPEA
ncbi:cold shock protein (beta-ribbon, CspA family) [Thiohalospira halophila DSM 15071]|uniref:Cold shock protein (Beta-ribbon, CspA family) n=1 Tax=Thiohalospira halophila DSM 15071 TaxID=1123397 RepID=A0A1I1P5P1_9GAMM|nr:cold shock domain-containing protein [Thiohalospira halophila]SFD02988.1 cold shock protein (beta-ribbon, CspA family) [Thiohalospira halophila DSM 15071]